MATREFKNILWIIVLIIERSKFIFLLLEQKRPGINLMEAQQFKSVITDWWKALDSLSYS